MAWKWIEERYSQDDEVLGSNVVSSSPSASINRSRKYTRLNVEIQKKL